jgi:hypothetical protein
MQYSVVYSKAIMAGFLVVALTGCTRSNPLLGKWKLAPNADPACGITMDSIEFTDKTITIGSVIKQIAPVTYGRDGERYLATTSTGTMAFEMNDDGIKSLTPFECLFVRAN